MARKLVELTDQRKFRPVAAPVALTTPVLGYSGGVATWLEGDSLGGGIASGTSFPGSPSTDDTFHRTDLDALFTYDGTRWVTLAQFAMHFERNGSVPEGISATTAAYKLAGLGQTIKIEAVYAGFFVSSGASALSASHKWVLDLHIVDSAGSAGSGFGTINIDSGSSNVFRVLTATGLSTVTLATDTVVEWSATKTGTPGNLQSWPRVLYRVIAT